MLTSKVRPITASVCLKCVLLQVRLLRPVGGAWGQCLVNRGTVFRTVCVGIRSPLISCPRRQWRIQLWAVRAPPPIDQNLGLAMAARLRHGSKFSLKSLTFGHFFCVKMYKKLSVSGGLCGGSAPGPPRPPFRLALRVLAMVLPWQILDPPLPVG